MKTLHQKRKQQVASLVAMLLLLIGGMAWHQAGASETASYTLHGRVVRVSDGDTFTLLAATRQQRVRMASIDAPETGQRSRPGQPWAQASRAALAALIAGKTLTLQCFEPDPYGRHICDVPLEDGTTANQHMVRQGMAWVNRQNKERFLRDRSLDALERTARAARQGLWRGENPVAPWVWRDQCWRKQHCGQEIPK